ncbi:hypothetical protein JCGZ_09933 [Jatropha curcas]|uniref:non-specific serine/threonine protein kinase n=1 Tax=Jatropha curcas TaxID=180498 RepID=A0A067KIA0_JATCU|nr:hypothetical protein JCGZ_09933 [Jatropha curcas]
MGNLLIIFLNSQPNTHFLLSLFIIIFSFPTLLKSSSASTPLNFSYPIFDSNHPDILTEGNTSVSNVGIELTMNLSDQKKGGSIGRATYKKPLHLWDKASGNLTNFTTHFSVFIDSGTRSLYGDGLAFFLAPNGSTIPPDTKSGGGLCLAINDSLALDFHENNFVAVEFDTYSNPWDPSTNHIGINIRSMKSITTVSWPSNKIEGKRTDAWISYDSSRKILDVEYTYIDGISSSRINGSLSAVVDLGKYLPEWVTFGFSGSTGSLYQINRITSWAFDSSSDIVDNFSSLNLEPAPSPVLSESKTINNGLMAGLIVGGVVRKQRKQTKTNDHVFDVSFDDDFRNGTGPRKFAYNELANVTKNFSESEKLGEGGFGAVYKGFLKDMNSFIAVKKVSSGSKQGIKEYAAEVKIISRMRHRNLVKLIGWCHEKELLLAYELMPNGSLDSHLFKGKSLLTWELRYKIAQGLALALLYLHEEGDQCVLHRDIKSSNIMLDSNFEAKLGDFGLARLVDHSKGSQTTILAGTMGYMAPECFTSGKASKESDIYSFGVVCLEIACGRRVVEPSLEENKTRIVEWVWELYGMGKKLEAADKKLFGNFNEQEMERLLIVGLWCVHPDKAFRPSIRQVINVLLTFDSPLPILPSEMPVPAYLTPPMKLSMSFLMSSCGSTTSNNVPISNSMTSSSAASSSPSMALLLDTR